MEQKLDFIHKNPVDVGFGDEEENYLFKSLRDVGFVISFNNKMYNFVNQETAWNKQNAAPAYEYYL